MSFFMNQTKKKYQEIEELNNEIISLHQKKSDIELEIQKIEFNLEKLKRQSKLANELISLEDSITQARKTLNAITSEIQSESKTFFNELLEKYPNLKPSKFNVLIHMNNSAPKIKFKDIKLAIDSSLIAFALTHNLDPNFYKITMYALNDSWVNRYNELASQFSDLNSDAYENYSLFNDFIILVDTNK